MGNEVFHPGFGHSGFYNPLYKILVSSSITSEYTQKLGRNISMSNSNIALLSGEPEACQMLVLYQKMSSFFDLVTLAHFFTTQNFFFINHSSTFFHIDVVSENFLITMSCFRYADNSHSLLCHIWVLLPAIHLTVCLVYATNVNFISK